MKKQWLYLLLCGSICFSVFDGTAQSVALGQDFEGNMGQAEMPVHLLKFESWNVKAHA